MMDGLMRAWQVARAAYAEDRARPKHGMRREEIEFLPAAVEVLETPASPVGRWFAAFIAALFIIALVWAWLGHIDTVAVAQGKIVPSGNVKVIQALEIGVVTRITVEDGQHVEQGDVMIELDPTETGADAERLTRELYAAELDAARLTALVVNPDDPDAAFVAPEGSDSRLVAASRALMFAQAEEFAQSVLGIEAEIRQRRAERETTNAKIRRFIDTAPLLDKRVNAWAFLAEKKYASELRLAELQEEQVSRLRELEVERRRLIEIAEAISVLERSQAERRAVFASQINGDLGEALRRAHSTAQDLAKATDRAGRRVLKAPVSGVVQQLAVHTVGGVVSPAEPLLVIVPDDTVLRVDAMVLNKDIGFVRTGQAVEVKIESFPFTKYGVIHGHLTQVSADAVADEEQGLTFPARVALESDRILVDDKWVALAPGMSATAEVKTGKRRVIEFFLSPFLRYQDEALRER